MSLQWLYLDLNSYFASVEQQLRPELRGKPVAVVPAITDATCAIAASYEAKAYGVKTGTMIYAAKRLCPGLICVQADHQHYIDFHHQILAEIDKYIPIEIIASIDEVACKLQGDECVEENAIALARCIKQGIKTNIGEYIRCSIGIAPNRFLAKTASNLEKPDGLQVLYASDVPARISHFVLNDLTGIGAGMLKRLNNAGIHTIEQLYALTPKHIRKIWGGVMGERYWYMLHGHEIANITTMRRTVGHSHVLEPLWRPHSKAKQVMQRLLLKAASRLRRMEYYATRMNLSLRIENGPRISSEARFHHSCDNINLMHHATDLWGNLIQKYHPALIKKIAITLHGLIKKTDIQPELFDNDNSAPQKETELYERISCAMDHINERFGRDSIMLGSLPDSVRSFSGTKVAFTKIPDLQEFNE